MRISNNRKRDYRGGNKEDVGKKQGNKGKREAKRTRRIKAGT